ncbi:hypothetical protein [Flagellimonas crocea]|uniref:hypothetical protein n=1 Tax=Flagellimonas crocea TaxID=3067311 RepID=UPI00296E6B4D|nr:hypothetical protein [Muricauda sp. DH64]
MQLLTIIWTLVCAALIIGYPIYLLRKSASLIKNHEEQYRPRRSKTVELLSFDIREQLPGWSFTLEVPQITEEILENNAILFYLESDSSCLKLPLKNAKIGYTAKVYKNVGKVYVTFKSIKDGVSNFYVPTWHLRKLKVLIIKSNDKKTYQDWNIDPNKSVIHKNLTKAGININDYEDVLGYFSNIASIDFKGHFVAKMPKQKSFISVMHKQQNEQEFYHSA